MEFPRKLVVVVSVEGASLQILLVSHYALPHQGGIEIVVDQLFRRFTEKGHRVTHLCAATYPPPTDTTSNNGRIRLPALNFFEKFAIPYPIFNPLRLWATLNELFKTTDIVNVQGMLYMDCVIAAWMAHKRHIPVVVTEYPGLVKYKNPLVNLLEAFAFYTIGWFCCRQASAAIIINQKVADKWVKPFLKPKTPILKVNVGVDTEHFSPVGLDEKSRLRQKWELILPTVLFVGRLVYRKGIDLLEEITDDEFDIIISGRGSFISNKPHIRVLGEVSSTELVELYRAADIFILLTDGHDFPLVGLEAISSGLPIVVFDTAANREYLDETCAVFTDRPKLKQAIKMLIRDQAKCIQMGQAARIWATEHFSWSYVTESYLQLFSELQSLS